MRGALLLVLLANGCATAEELAVKAARRDFPKCEQIRNAGHFFEEVIVEVCGIPMTYEVTPLEIRRKR